ASCVPIASLRKCMRLRLDERRQKLEGFRDAERVRPLWINMTIQSRECFHDFPNLSGVSRFVGADECEEVIQRHRSESRMRHGHSAERKTVVCQERLADRGTGVLECRPRRFTAQARWLHRIPCDETCGTVEHLVDIK